MGEINTGQGITTLNGLNIGGNDMATSHRIALKRMIRGCCNGSQAATYANPASGVYLAHGTYTYEREDSFAT